MATKQEVIHDALDSAFEADGEQEASEDMVGSILAEAGLDSLINLKTTNASQPGSEGKQPVGNLESRLLAVRPP